MKFFYIILAWLSLGLAFLGLMLPGLPATEFILLAVWAAGKGSPKLQQWILQRPIIGQMYYDWQEHRSIALRYKIASSVSMTLCLTMLYFTVSHTPSVIYTGIGMSLGALYIWTRPTARKTPISYADTPPPASSASHSPGRS